MCGRSFLHWDTTGSFQQVSAGTGHSCSFFRLYDRRASSNFSGPVRRSWVSGIVSFHSQLFWSDFQAPVKERLPHGGRDPPWPERWAGNSTCAMCGAPRSCTGEADAYCVRIATVALCLSLDGSINYAPIFFVASGPRRQEGKWMKSANEGTRAEGDCSRPLSFSHIFRP